MKRQDILTLIEIARALADLISRQSFFFRVALIILVIVMVILV